MVNVGPLTAASRPGLPALRPVPERGRALLTRLKPYLGGLVPIIDYINDLPAGDRGLLRQQHRHHPGHAAVCHGGNLHYLRISNPINPEVLAAYQRRLKSNRSNP